MNISNKLTPLIPLMLIGGALGYLYYMVWGCESGCTIKGSPWIMTLYGVFFGYLLGDIIFKRKKKTVHHVRFPEKEKDKNTRCPSRAFIKGGRVNLHFWGKGNTVFVCVFSP